MNDSTILFEVVSVLADIDGVDPVELEYSLAEYIEPSILEMVVSNDTGAPRITFTVPNHEVTVTNDREIIVDGVKHQYGERKITIDADKTRDHSRESLPTFDDLPFIIYQCRNNPQLPLEFIGGGCQELTGYDPHSFIIGGMTYLDDIIHPADRKSVAQLIQRSMRRQEPVECVHRIQTIDGDQKRVWTNGDAVTVDGEPIGFQGITAAMDPSRIPTERDAGISILSERDAETPIQTSLESADTTSSSNLYFVIDRDGVYRDVMAGPDTTDLLFDDPSVLRGSLVDEALPAEPAQRILTETASAIDTVKPHRFTYTLPVPAGHRRFEAVANPLVTTNDEEQACLLIVSDSTKKSHHNRTELTR